MLQGPAHVVLIACVALATHALWLRGRIEPPVLSDTPPSSGLVPPGTKQEPLGTPKSVLPTGSRDDEAVPPIPLKEGITDFEDIRKGAAAPEKEKFGFPPGCARSFPSGEPLDMEAMVKRHAKRKEHAAGAGRPPEAGGRPCPGGVCPPGAPPRCPSFSTLTGRLEDWLQGRRESWVATTEALVPRLVSTLPQKTNTNALLLCPGFHCDAARYDVHVRLEEGSEAGVAFRIPSESTSTYLVASLSVPDGTNPGRVALWRLAKGQLRAVASRPVPTTGGGVLNKLTVIDHGPSNHIEVLVNDNRFLAQDFADEPASRETNGAGLFIRSGNAAFSHISFAPL